MEILFWFILALAIVFEITCISIVFTKADKPGWGAIVPIYGIMLLCDTAGRPRWWTLLCVIPLVNVFAFIGLSIGVARHFDRSDAFGVGLAVIPVVFWAILAFSDAEYDAYESTERIVPAKRTTPASAAPRPVSHRHREAAPVLVQRLVPASQEPVAVERPQQEAPPSFAERAVLASAAPVLVSRAQADAALAGDSAVERPRIARCPSCRKFSVGVVEEAGIRRCGNCLAVLPSYIRVTG